MERVVEIRGQKRIVIEKKTAITNNSLEHIQNTPSTTWIVNHNTGVKRTLEFFSIGGMKINGDVHIVNENQTIGYFLIPVAGFAKII